MPRSALLAAAALLLLGAALPLRAQVVEGRLADARSGEAVPGALVVLLDSAGATVARALADPAGRYRLRAPRAGRFRLRADRLGYVSGAPVEVTVGVDGAARRDLRVGAAPVGLEALEVRARGRRCAPRPRDPATAAVWGEVRKALDATLAGETEGYTFAFQKYRRDLGPDGVVRAESRIDTAVAGAPPYGSVPVERLAAEGYLQTVGGERYFFAPDARVLLSDLFLQTHCFHLEARGDSLLGLGFEPVRGARPTEVAGTLWLEPGSAALRWLEFRYVNLPRGEPGEGLGGRVEFERLPTGAWMVRRWWIRMPVVQRVVTTRREMRGRVEGAARDEVAGFREEGGEVRAVSAPGGRAVLAASSAVLRGTVHDSVTAAPLAGARVFLSGTAFATLADSAGRFALEGLPAGEYTASFEHPTLESLGAVPPSRRVRLAEGAVAEVSLAAPSLATVGAWHCPGLHGGVVVGRVRDRSGTPAAGAVVRVVWGRGGVEVRADGTGFYAACGVEGGRVTLSAAAGAERARGTVEMTARVMRHDLELAAAPRPES